MKEDSWKTHIHIERHLPQRILTTATCTIPGRKEYEEQLILKPAAFRWFYDATSSPEFGRRLQYWCFCHIRTHKKLRRLLVVRENFGPLTEALHDTRFIIPITGCQEAWLPLIFFFGVSGKENLDETTGSST